MNNEDAFPKVYGEEKNEITRWIFMKLSSKSSEVKDAARLEIMNKWTEWFYLYHENLGSMKNWKNLTAVWFTQEMVEAGVEG